MKELSLYVLDITMNSVRAGAGRIEIKLIEKNGVLDMYIIDNGCGMTKEQVENLSNPFFTTRKTRKVGLGVPFLRMLAEMTGGTVSIESIPEAESEDHGTTVHAVFNTDHIDFVPLGDIIETVITLIQGSPEVDFEFLHETEDGQVRLSVPELRQILGDDIPLSSFEILDWIKGFLTEQYDALT